MFARNEYDPSPFVPVNRELNRYVITPAHGELATRVPGMVNTVFGVSGGYTSRVTLDTMVRSTPPGTLDTLNLSGVTGSVVIGNPLLGCCNIGLTPAASAVLRHVVDFVDLVSRYQDQSLADGFLFRI
jgi:hypothetical protein